jgi:hypothetical protein
MSIARSYLIVDDARSAVGFRSQLPSLDCRLLQRCHGGLCVAQGALRHPVSLSVVSLSMFDVGCLGPPHLDPPTSRGNASCCATNNPHNQMRRTPLH